MGTTYINFIGTTTGFIIALNPYALFDGEWQPEPMPHVVLAPAGLFDGEWQSDPVTIVALAP